MKPSFGTDGIWNHAVMEHEHRWDLVDAVSRSPLLGSPQIRPGIDLADVERRLLGTDAISASDRERLIGAVRELAEVYGQIGTH